MPALFKRHRAIRLRHRMSDDRFFQIVRRKNESRRPTMADPGRRALIEAIRQRELENALEDDEERLHCMPNVCPAIAGFFTMKRAQPQAGG